MNVIEALHAVRAVGGTVSVDGGSLLVDAPANLPPNVWEALEAHKTVLVDLLAPIVTYAAVSAQEEREAIQEEAQAPADALSFAPPQAARRCRLVRDTTGIDPNRGRVTFPAGLAGVVIAGLDEIEDPFQRIHSRYLVQEERAAGREPIIVLIDGRPRVLDASSVLIIEGEHAHG